MQPFHDSDDPRGLWAARAAFVVGLLYAAVTVYWVLGGTWLLDTAREDQWPEIRR